MAQVRRAFGTRAVGHAGTLDPFATGLLVLLVGPATRLARFVEGHRKGYVAQVTLGRSTTTDDRTGDTVGTGPAGVWPEESEVRQALADLTGTYAQRPPAYSARRVGGRRGYELARAGVAAEPPAREVTVYALELQAYNPPEVRLRAEVSPGTYIRAIARDLGARLGTLGHCRELRREWIGPFRVEQAIAPERVARDTTLLAPLELLSGMPTVELDDDAARAAGHGRAVAASGGGAGPVALARAGRLVAVAERCDAGWHPRVVLETA